jgi:hypothetical protein
MRKLIFVQLVMTIFLMSIPIITRSSDNISLIFLPGEEYRYSVKWGFLRLGTITVRTLEYQDSENPNTVRSAMIVESSPYIPFVKIFEYNEALIDLSTLGSLEYLGDYQNRSDRTLIRTSYSAETGTAWYYQLQYHTGDTLKSKTLDNVSHYVDGPSLLAFTRARSCKRDVYEVATMVNGEIKNTILDFTGPTEDIKISAWPFPVRTRKYTGTADWEGGTSQGLSGRFTGWVSEDFAAVIIRAEMKVILGSVRIELESWERPDWTPLASQRTVKK